MNDAQGFELRAQGVDASAIRSVLSVWTGRCSDLRELGIAFLNL